tara:strand:+ start:1391 stop:1912 length:522 start_codon:yes stop_codon:yes gene_type:complete
MVIWITGLSGAGKTTLGKSVYDYYKKKFPNTLWFDGETTNLLTDQKRKYDRISRINQYYKNIKFYQFCNLQKINLIISCLYFDINLQKNNRKIFKKNYYEIYLKSNIEELIKRDSKNTYKKNLSKKKPNIVGYDIKWRMPKGSNFIVDSFHKKNLMEISKKIITKTKKNFNKF